MWVLFPFLIAEEERIGKMGFLQGQNRGNSPGPPGLCQVLSFVLPRWLVSAGEIDFWSDFSACWSWGFEVYRVLCLLNPGGNRHRGTTWK